MGTLTYRPYRCSMPWSTRWGSVLQSQAIPARTNELGAIRSFLEKMVLTGRVVSFDALYTHPDLAQLIVDRNGHYLMGSERTNGTCSRH